MWKFSETSKRKLDTCHEDIILVCNEVIKRKDCSIREGFRSLKTQQEYFKKGYSLCDGINKKSKHQTYPSLAVDIAPYPTLYSDENEFKKLAKIIYQVVQELLYSRQINSFFEWGGTWTKLKDLPHWQIKEI